MQTTERTNLDRLAVDTVRVLAMDAIQKAGSGHPGTAMALAPAARADSTNSFSRSESVYPRTMRAM